MYAPSISIDVLLLLTTINSFISIVESTELATCYFPDSTIATNFVACSPTQNGGCCQAGDFCTQYGYCVSQSKGYHYRGACTDGSWGNPSCPDYCLSSQTGNATCVDVIACNAAASDGTWCCAYEGNCCSSSATFVPGFGTMFAEPGGATSTSSNNAVSSASTTQSSLASSTSLEQTAPPSSTSSTATANPSSSSSSLTSKSSNSSTIIGAAVGIPLGLALCASLFLFYRERQKRKRINTNADSGNNTMNKTMDGSISPGVPSSAEIVQSPSRQLGSHSEYYTPQKEVIEQSVQEVAGLGRHELEEGGRTYELGGCR